jgi:hypothetical protein
MPKLLALLLALCFGTNRLFCFEFAATISVVFGFSPEISSALLLFWLLDAGSCLAVMGSSIAIMYAIKNKSNRIRNKPKKKKGFIFVRELDLNYSFKCTLE